MNRRFKNGNINVRLDPDELSGVKKGSISAFEALSWELDAVDTYLVGDEFCLSNFDMGVYFYSAYSDAMFLFPMSELEKLKEGKTVKLYAKAPDADDREYLREKGF